MTDGVNPNQAIFDAIVAATSHSMFLAMGTITIDTDKFIETFNNHRDRALCTALDVVSSQKAPSVRGESWKEGVGK